MCYWLKNSDTFDGTFDREWLATVAPHMMKLNEEDKLSSLRKDISFKTGCYPENFRDIAEVFDKYVKYYESRYDDLMKYMAQNMPSDLMLCCKSIDRDFTLDDFEKNGHRLSRGQVLKSSDLFKFIAKTDADALVYSKLADDMNKSLE